MGKRTKSNRSDDERKAMFANMKSGSGSKKSRTNYNPPKVRNPNKNMSQEEYMFGDADKDGTKNIDDYRPYDKTKENWPDPKKNPEYYHRARYGGFDTKMSDTLKDVKRRNDESAYLLDDVLKKHPDAKGRIKTVPSTVGKMSKYNHKDVHDVAGVKILTKDRKEAKQIAGEIKRKYPTDPKETDDFYAHPLNDVYYAYHIGVLDEKRNRLEVQVKSEKMEKLSDEMHTSYKRGEDLTPYKKRAKKLYDQGY